MKNFSYIKFGTYLVNESELKTINTIKDNNSFVFIDRLEDSVVVSFNSNYSYDMINSLLNANCNNYKLIDISDKPYDYCHKFIIANNASILSTNNVMENEINEFRAQMCIDKQLYEIFGCNFNIDPTGTIIIELNIEQSEQLYENQLLNIIKLYGSDSLSEYDKSFLETRFK